MSMKTRDEIIARYEAAARDIDAGLTPEEAQQNLMTKFGLSDTEALEVLANLPRYLKQRGGRGAANEWKGLALFALPVGSILIALIAFGSYLSNDPLGMPALILYAFFGVGILVLSYLFCRRSWYGYDEPTGFWLWFDIFEWWD